MITKRLTTRNFEKPAAAESWISRYPKNIFRTLKLLSVEQQGSERLYQATVEVTYDPDKLIPQAAEYPALRKKGEVLQHASV